MKDGKVFMLSLTTKKGSREFFSHQRILLFYVNQPISYFLGLIFTKTWIGSDTHITVSFCFFFRLDIMLACNTKEIR